jgi:hypothetical protein
MNWKGYGNTQSWRHLRTNPTFAWSDCRKSLETSVVIAGAPVEMRTNHMRLQLQSFASTSAVPLEPGTPEWKGILLPNRQRCLHRYWEKRLTEYGFVVREVPGLILSPNAEYHDKGSLACPSSCR